jgi:hypothetical protein
MKKIFTISLSILLGLSFTIHAHFASFQPTESLLSAPFNNPDTYGPEISFDKTKHNFGTIKQGVPVKYKFKFTNTGNSNLIIKDAKAGCGCTTPVWPVEPIAPGKTGFIEVGYDAKAEGNFVKDIKVQTNGGEVKLIITGVVEVEASEPEENSIKLPNKIN